MSLEEAVYAAIREKTGTGDPYGWSVKNDICYDIALRAAEIAVGREEAGAAENGGAPVGIGAAGNGGTPNRAGAAGNGGAPARKEAAR